MNFINKNNYKAVLERLFGDIWEKTDFTLQPLHVVFTDSELVGITFPKERLMFIDNHEDISDAIEAVSHEFFHTWLAWYGGSLPQIDNSDFLAMLDEEFVEYPSSMRMEEFWATSMGMWTASRLSGYFGLEAQCDMKMWSDQYNNDTIKKYKGYINGYLDNYIQNFVESFKNLSRNNHVITKIIFNSQYGLHSSGF
jgi:hypothetical protein